MNSTTCALPPRPRRWRRAGVVTGLMITVLVSTGLLIPTAVNHTTWRNSLLCQALQPYGLTATADWSSGGWLTPFQFGQVVISDKSGHIRCHVERLQTDHTILQYLSGDSVRTSIQLSHPQFEISFDENGHLPLNSADTGSERDVCFQVDNAELVLRVPWRNLPIVDLDGLTFRGAVTQSTDGRWLSIDGVDLMNRAPLSENDTEQNLALIAPLISQTTSLRGSVSVQLQPVFICLDQEFSDGLTLLQGTVQVESLKARLRPTWSQQIGQLAQRLHPAALPEQLQLCSRTSIDFRVTPEGIHHDGCSVELPEVGSGVTLVSSGVLRLDEQLDLAVTARVPVLRRSGNSLLNSLAGLIQAPLQLRVTGSVSDPQIELPGGGPELPNGILHPQSTTRISSDGSGHRQTRIQKTGFRQAAPFVDSSPGEVSD